MEFLDYLKEYNLDIRDESKLSDEQLALKDVIETIIQQFRYDLKELYYAIINYYFFQNEYDYKETIQKLELIFYIQDKINSNIFVWFRSDSPLLNYCNLEKLNNEVFESCSTPYIELNQIIKYKDYIYKEYSNSQSIYLCSLLKEDAKSEFAKQYFGCE